MHEKTSVPCTSSLQTLLAEHECLVDPWSDASLLHVTVDLVAPAITAEHHVDVTGWFSQQQASEEGQSGETNQRHS